MHSTKERLWPVSTASLLSAACYALLMPLLLANAHCSLPNFGLVLPPLLFVLSFWFARLYGTSTRASLGRQARRQAPRLYLDPELTMHKYIPTAALLCGVHVFATLPRVTQALIGDIIAGSNLGGSHCL